MKNLLITLGLMATLLAGCTTSSRMVFPADPSILRVGITPNSPPMIYEQSSGEIAGVEADLAWALGRELGRTVLFTERKWEDLSDALVNDEIDIIMSGMSITAGRRSRMLFAEPYLKIGQMALVRSDEQYKYVLNLEGIAERGVGVEQGTTAEQLVRQRFPRVTVKTYSSGEKAAEALINKDVDLYFSDAPMIWYLSGQYGSRGLSVAPMLYSEEYLAWGIQRTDPQLLNEVNAFLEKVRRNGELTVILKQWLPGYQEN